ncbi:MULTISPECIES: LysR substrate-binding domain-containing protein [unclassified Mesorhizobium]|uniref:LysR substrate-binding domain-containing protein n=1 Tax=unclassified Mesorhizobium TaxID=325217 RepID=UPI000A01EA55
MEQLEHHDLIALSKAWARPLPMLAGDRKIGVDLTGGLTCDDLLTVRALVAIGLGISFLPGYLAHQLDLVRVLPELRSPFTGLVFAYPAQKWAQRHRSHLVQMFDSSVVRGHVSAVGAKGPRR